MNDTLVSIVVPVYNVEEYLKCCIDSILGQTYEKIEIILVNDGSPDKCPQICDVYADNDDRIKVIHKKNGGLSDARNVGLEVANGEYITFVDSDDYLHKDFISKLYKELKETGSDIALCDYRDVGEEELEQFAYGDKDIVRMSNNECLKGTYQPKQHGMCFVTWGKLYKRNLFITNSIDFPLGKIHEDTFTTYKLYYYASKISFVPSELYYYRQHSGSIMNNGFSLKHLDQLEAMHLASIFFYKKGNYNLLGYALNAELNACLRMFDEVKNEYNGNEMEKICTLIRIQYFEDLDGYLNSAKIPIIKKLYYRFVPIFRMKYR